MATDQPRGLHTHSRWDLPVTAAPLDDRFRTAGRWPWWMLDAVRARQRTTPPERLDALTDVHLPDHEGRSVRLGDLWRDGPAVIVWLRQFGARSAVPTRYN